MQNQINIGTRYGRLLILSYAKGKGMHTYYNCHCDCSSTTIKMVRFDHLKYGHTKSCGCLIGETASIHNKTHGIRDDHPLYVKWIGIKERCYNSNHHKYKNYGKRGIIVCDQWRHNFLAFYNWSMENGYKDDLTIERNNVDGNYEPSNCCFIEDSKQCENKTNTHKITVFGETLPLFIAVRKYSTLSYKLVWSRLKKGWRPEDALLYPKCSRYQLK